MHVLKLGKVVDEIAEHVIEKRVRRDLLIQRRTVRGSVVRRALLVMKHAACPRVKYRIRYRIGYLIRCRMRC